MCQRTTSTRHDPDPWLRQPDESSRAYDAFRHYREMGPKRSLAKVASERGCSVRLLERWSSTHRWVIRALCYDNYLDLQQQKRYEQTMFDEAGRRAQQARKIEERALARVTRIDLSRLSLPELLRVIDLGMKLEMRAYTYYDMV